MDRIKWSYFLSSVFVDVCDTQMQDPENRSHKIATAHKKCHQFPNRSYFLLLGFAFQCCDTVRYIFVCVAFIHFMISVDLFCCCCFPHAHFSLTYRACIECARFRAIANVLSWNVRTLLLFFSRRIFLSLYIFFLTLQFSMHFQVVITLHFFRFSYRFFSGSECLLCVCRCLCSVDTDVINGMNISAVFENDRPRKSPENKLHKTNIQITTLNWTTGFFSAQQHIFKCKYLSQLTFPARTKDFCSLLHISHFYVRLLLLFVSKRVLHAIHIGAHLVACDRNFVFGNVMR